MFGQVKGYPSLHSLWSWDLLAKSKSKYQKITNLISSPQVREALLNHAALDFVESVSYTIASTLIENGEIPFASVFILAAAFVVYKIAKHRFARSCVAGMSAAIPKNWLSPKWLIPLAFMGGRLSPSFSATFSNTLALYVCEMAMSHQVALVVLPLLRMTHDLLERSRFSETPVVIFLNGTSSAGKTSIAKQIQKLSEKLFVYVGIDHYIAMLPPSYLPDGKQADLGYKVTLHPGPTRTVTCGEVAKRYIYAMHRTMRTMLDQGFNLILDEVLVAQDEFDDYLALFKDFTVLFISVHPPLPVAIQREKARGDREEGFARGFYPLVHRGKTYDLAIDSSQQSPEQSAQTILAYLAAHPSPSAFNSHRNDLPFSQ